MENVDEIIKLARKNYLKYRKKILPYIALLNKKRKIYYKKFILHAQKRPISTFAGLLLMLLGLIIISNAINRPKDASEIGLPAKEVTVYTIGTSPKITVQAQVEKSGVIKVVALGSGVVQNIGVEVGQEVWQGTNLVSLSTNYQGGNAFSLNRQIAQASYKNAKDTYNTSKELIDKQKELAEKSDKNSDELRNISNKSLDGARSLISLNNDILTTLEVQQTDLESGNAGGANDSAILQTKQLRAQLMSANNALEAGLRNTEYSGSDDKIPAEISNLSKDIALKQLDLQQKALDLNLEIGRLGLTLAQINEAIMFPASPVNGVVERVYVRVGQVVTPGSPLVQISGNSQSLIAVAFLSKEMADGVSRVQVSTLHLGKESFESAPFYVSQDATDGSLYTAQFQIPIEFSSKVADKGYIMVEIPVDFPKTGSAVPFVPIDSVFQTQDQAFLFVAKNGKAQSKQVRLGQVLGRFVEIKSGLSQEDQVILNRNIISGDPIRISN